MKKKRLCGIAALILLLLLLACALWLFRDRSEPAEEPAVQTADGEVYESPIDFAAYQKENKEVYAYLEIPGTGVSYPVVQAAEDDTFYLTHNAAGEEDSAGALFTEHTYNSNDMSDYLTLIYGHRQNNGDMFGTLQQTFSNTESFQNLDSFIVYLPDGELHYEIFAAVPYDNRHIMYTYTTAADYGDDSVAQTFLDSIYGVRALDANFRDTQQATTDDHIVVLSTCQKGNRQNRYLVLGRLIEEKSVLPVWWQ